MVSGRVTAKAIDPSQNIKKPEDVVVLWLDGQHHRLRRDISARRADGALTW